MDEIVIRYYKIKTFGNTIAILITHQNGPFTLNRSESGLFTSNCPDTLQLLSLPKSIKIDKYNIVLLYPSSFKFNFQHLIFSYFLICLDQILIQNINLNINTAFKLIFTSQQSQEFQENFKNIELINFNIYDKEKFQNFNNLYWLYRLLVNISISTSKYYRNEYNEDLLESCFQAYKHQCLDTQNDNIMVDIEKSELNNILFTIYNYQIPINSYFVRIYIRFIIACIDPDFEFPDGLTMDKVENDDYYYNAVQTLIDYFCYRFDEDQNNFEQISQKPLAYILVKFIQFPEKGCFISTISDKEFFKQKLEYRGYTSDQFVYIHKDIKDDNTTKIKKMQDYLKQQLNSCKNSTNESISIFTSFLICKDCGFNMDFVFEKPEFYTFFLDNLKILLTIFKKYENQIKADPKTIYERFNNMQVAIEKEHIIYALYKMLEDNKPNGVPIFQSFNEFFNKFIGNCIEYYNITIEQQKNDLIEKIEKLLKVYSSYFSSNQKQSKGNELTLKPADIIREFIYKQKQSNDFFSKEYAKL